MRRKHDCGFRFNYRDLLGHLYPLLADQRNTGEDCGGKAECVVRFVASNSAGLQLRSAREPAFAPAYESIHNTARGLDRRNGRLDMRLGIVRDAVGALDTGYQLEQRRNFQTGP